jgi:hypothetical protein
VQLEQLAARKQLGDEAQVLKRLFEIAGRKGEGAQLDRLVALYELAVGYGNISAGQRGDKLKLHHFEDRFALKRVSEAMAKSYWEAAMKLFPRLPPLVTERVQYSAGVAPNLKVFDWVFKKSHDQLLGEHNALGPHKLWLEYLLINVSNDIDVFARMLHLDQRLEVALEDNLYHLALKLQPDEKWKRQRQEELALQYRKLVELDKSTAIFNALSTNYPKDADAQELRHLAAQIDTNAKLSKMLHDAKHLEWAREYALLTLGGSSSGYISDYDAQKFLGDALAPPALKELTKLRAWPGSDYLLVGEGPLWVVRGHETLSTGPRFDGLRAGAIRFYQKETKQQRDTLGVLDGVPRRDVSARFHVSFAPAADWWPDGVYPKKTDASLADVKYDRGRPEVGFLFGARDVDVDLQRDAGTQRDTLVRPLRGLAVRIKPDAVELVEVIETKRQHQYLAAGPDEFAMNVKQTQKAELSGKTELDVSIDVAGDSVKVTVGDKTFKFAAPPDRTGFYGLHLRGNGYAEISRLKISSRLQ